MVVIQIGTLAEHQFPLAAVELVEDLQEMLIQVAM
tara:strand:- start:195 stop:299 length:105 start_codon:yes stop_codon:yes gene_type:complete